MTIPAGDRVLTCPEHGPLPEVAVFSYTREGGVPNMHLRAACPECGKWVSPVWFIPRRLAGLPPRTQVEDET